MDQSVRLGIGERLRSERNRLGLSQPALASALGVGKLTILFYEHGRAPLKVEALTHLDELGFDVLFIATGRRSPGGLISVHRRRDLS